MSLTATTCGWAGCSRTEIQHPPHGPADHPFLPPLRSRSDRGAAAWIAALVAAETGGRDLLAAHAFARALGPPDRSWLGALNPIALQRARVVFGRRRTHTFIRDRDQVYREELQMLWRATRMRRIPDGDLAVLVAFARRSSTPADVTNLLKAVEDAGNEILWEDDRQIRTELGVIVEWGANVAPAVALDIWRLR